MSATYPDHPGSKAGVGPSLEAAKAIEHITTDGPCTADECAKAIDLSVLAVQPRVSELVRLGKLKATGERRRNSSGLNASVWRAT